jgi:hypothetical protein
MLKKTAIVSLFTFISASYMAQNTTPVYLDESKPVEQRIQDALSRMTLEEKVAMLHAQSNSVHQVFQDWEFLNSGQLTDLTEYALK